MSSQILNESKNVLTSTVDSSMNYMNLGFTLAAALAWTDAAKMLVKQMVSKSNSQSSVLVGYPLAVTLLAVLVFKMSKVVNPDGSRPVVVPVVTA